MSATERQESHSVEVEDVEIRQTRLVADPGALVQPMTTQEAEGGEAWDHYETLGERPDLETYFLNRVSSNLLALPLVAYEPYPGLVL